MSGTSTLAYFILALAIGYAFVYPSVGDISNLLVQKGQYEDSLATVANIEVQKNKLLADFDKISEQDKKNMEIVLPNDFDYVRLISQIDTVAAAYGISIKDLSSTVSDSSVGETVATAEAPRAYQGGIIGFSFDASYNNFRSFMKELEESLRILDIKSASVEVGEGGVYTYKVEFETYWLQ